MGEISREDTSFFFKKTKMTKFELSEMYTFLKIQYCQNQYNRKLA